MNKDEFIIANQTMSRIYRQLTLSKYPANIDNVHSNLLLSVFMFLGEALLLLFGVYFMLYR